MRLHKSLSCSMYEESVDPPNVIEQENSLIEQRVHQFVDSCSEGLMVRGGR